MLGGLEVVDEGAGGVLPHERTTPKASTDRLDLTRATSANLSPVWGLSLAAGLTELLRQPGEPVGLGRPSTVSSTVVERVTDQDRIDAIAAAVASDDVLIADGHHRYGVSRIYRDEIRQATGRNDTDAELTLAFVSELIDEQLSVEAIHRLYTDVDGGGRCSTRLDRRFEIESRPVPRRRARWRRWNVTAGCSSCAATVRVRGSSPDPGPSTSCAPSTARGSSTPSTSVDHDVTYQHGRRSRSSMRSPNGTSRGRRADPAGRASPRSPAQRAKGLLMPPKSTFFTPKLRTGFVVRSAGWPALQGYVIDAVKMPSIVASRAASNSSSLCCADSPSVSAREKLAITPGLRASRALASSRL